MANTLSKIGITSGSKVEAWHVTQSIDAFTGIEAYDITLSGSLTVTGSVTLSQPINVNFSGNSLYSITSSYSNNSDAVAHAITTDSAGNDTICLQFQHTPTNITQNTTYFMGGGNITTTGSFNPASVMGLPAAGIISPVNGTIVAASVTSTCLTTGSFKSDLYLGLDDYTVFAFSNPVFYNNIMVSFNENVGLNINSGERIMFQIDTKTGTNPTGVVHNINLYIQL
jgi:hypothetical protein